MEIKAELNKPYSNNEKMKFIVQNNHNLGYEIKETATALEAWGLTDAEKQEQKRERINSLSMTKREMFLGLYQAKGITPDMLKAQIADPAALIEFEYANDYFRGNPLVDTIGAQLGFSGAQLDKFFETKDYHYLTTCTLTINTIPENAIVTINEVEQNTITVPYETIVDYKVEYKGFLGQVGQIQLTEDKTIEVELTELIAGD